jgi:hypothetical protein
MIPYRIPRSSEPIEVNSDIGIGGSEKALGRCAWFAWMPEGAFVTCLLLIQGRRSSKENSIPHVEVAEHVLRYLHAWD